MNYSSTSGLNQTQFIIIRIIITQSQFRTLNVKIYVHKGITLKCLNICDIYLKWFFNLDNGIKWKTNLIIFLGLNKIKRSFASRHCLTLRHRHLFLSKFQFAKPLPREFSRYWQNLLLWERGPRKCLHSSRLLTIVLNKRCCGENLSTPKFRLTTTESISNQAKE